MDRRDYLAILWRRRWVFAITAAVTVIVAVLAAAVSCAPEAPATEPGAAAPKQPKGGGKGDDNPITDYLKSREGRATVNTVARGVFGVLKGLLK